MATVEITEMPLLAFAACSCGNADPSPDAWVFRAGGYKRWSEANGVPMVPVMWWAICRRCRRQQAARVVPE